MHLHMVVSKRLAESSALADELRAEARRVMVEAVADAHQAGMTQREIAAELNRSQPEVSRLLKLSPPRFKPRSKLGRELVSHRSELIDALGARGARNIRVFGSVARGEDDEKSDIDLLVDTPDKFSLFDHGGLIHAAQTVLGDKVDIVPARSLKGRIREAVMRDAVAL